MVFESVVTDVLNKILGDYVENLDRKQLKIGIWGGDVVLHNLKLRENALDDIDLPVRLVYGYLGKLVLKIPWKNLYSQPVVAHIEDFYILVSPKVSVEYDAEKEEKFELQAKLSALAAIDEAHKQELEKENPKPDASFTEKLTAQIVNNLQVKIANVHLRYEDTTTTGKPFCFGVTLHDLELYTTDSNWEKCYLTEQVSRVFKIADLDSLSVYMNCTTELFSQNKHEGLTELFRKNIASKESTPPSYSYLFGPISSIAKLQLNMSPQYDNPPFVLPKIDLSLELKTLHIGLTSTQFQDIVKLAESMNRMQLGAPYRKYRPFNKPYKRNYSLWWEFAITAVLEEEIRKRNKSWTWEHIKEHRQLCNTYAEKFKEKELTKKPAANLIETCTLLEQKLDLFNLILIRKRVQIEVDKIRKEEETKQQSRKGSWLGSWFGGRKKSLDEESSDIATKFEAAMTLEEKRKLYRAIGYEENAVPLHLPEEYEAINMNFKLIALEIGLYDDQKEYQQRSVESNQQGKRKTIMLLRFSMATCNIKQRPAANALSVTAGMKELKLTGLELGESVPTLIESKVTDEFNLLDILFETNPLDKKCNQRIRVHARPLQIVYNAGTILHLMKVFSPPQAVNLSELEGAATARMSNFKERSVTGMQYMIDRKSILDVDIKFMPNILIIPHNGSYEPGKNSLIVITLGQLNIVSKPRAISVQHSNTFQISESGTVMWGDVKEKAYDSFRVSIDDMQVVVAKPHERWEDILLSAVRSEMHVLRPTSLTIEVHMCVVGDDPRLPKTKVDIELPSIALNITEERIFEALNVVTSIPLPEKEAPAPQLLPKSDIASSRLSLASFLNPENKQKKPSNSSVETGSEIVQYTDLELNFALKHFKATLYKSFSTHESCSPTESEAYGTPVENVESTVEQFDECDNVVGATGTLEKLLTFQMLQLEANFCQRTYEMVATAKLGAVQLLQYDSCDAIEERLKIIDTPRFSEELEYLLTVSYTMAQRISPEFVTKYNSTEQLIRINFSTLHITLHQECLLRLMEIATTLQRKLEAAKGASNSDDRFASAASDNIINKLSTIIEEVEEGIVTAAPESRQHSIKVVDSIKIRVVANLEQVALLLTCRKRPLATLKVEHFNANLILKSSYTELNLCLKDIIVTDMNPKNIHTSILSIVGNNALDCQVVMYNLEETANYNSDDMKISVEIGCMKIVFLNWFVAAVLSFLNNFQAAQEAVAQASAAAADAAKQNALVAYEKATRMKFDIKIKAPIIVLPKDSQSTDAIALDLGMLVLHNTTNEVHVPNNERSPAIVDDIKLELKDMKLSKVAIIADLTHQDTDDISIIGSTDTVDLAYGLKSNVNILDPMSFTLGVKRNLSSGWYKKLPELDISGRLKSIELNLAMEDYAIIMSIINRNLNEGLDEFPPPTPTSKPRQTATSVDVHRKTSRQTEVGSPSLSVPKQQTPPESKIYEQLKFNFQFDGVVANLMLSNDEGLARFGLYFLSVKGNKLIDGTLSTSVVLCNVQIDDTRKNTTSQIKKYLCRKDWKYKEDYVPADILEECRLDRNYMVDLTAIIKENDTFAEVRVCGFDLILCVDYLLHLAKFFTLPEEAAPIASPRKTPIDTFETVKSLEIRPSGRSTQATAFLPPAPENKMNLTLHIEEPDIILVETLEDITSSAIIFNAQAELHYRVVGEKQIVNGEIDGLKMYMCSFMPERREATRHYIIHPCVISLQGSTPAEEGMHVSLKLSEIIINVSPATIELFNKAIQTISAGSAEKKATLKNEANYKEIWNPQKFEDKDHWFSRIDVAQEALEFTDSVYVMEQKIKTEKCVVEVPCITLVVEMGVGYYTTPLISIDTRLNAIVSDWSRNVKVKGSLSLNMNYYNQALAVWEPIIEMIEHGYNAKGEKEYLPWELSFGLKIDSIKNEINEDTEQSTTKINIHSAENLEVTLSKTCLTLLGVLGEAFSQAIDAKGLTKPEVIAPYVVENDTGFDISIDFRRGIFTLHECHMPNATNRPLALNRALIFQAEGAEAEVVPEQVKDCKISPGGRAYLQTKDLSSLRSEEDEEYNIYLKVGGIDKQIVLPVSKSDQRYFPLHRGLNQDSWGIVSEVRSEYGTTKLNVHGVLNVNNHFTTTVKIYRNKPGGLADAKILVGEVAPGEVFHVPLHAIYADFKDLYFAVEGYKVSVQSIRWTDAPTDLEYTRQLQCDPIDTFETFYINVMRVKTEIFHEHSDKHTLHSAFYTLHIRPPLYLCNALPISIKVSVAGCSVRHSDQPKEDQAKLENTAKSAIKEDLLDYGEKDVDPGDVLHLPTVKLSGRSKESLSFLVVRLIQYLEKDWSCTTEISADHKEFATWKFSSYDSEAKMDLDLFVRFTDRYGSLQITLFSPFWMINKTGLMLSYKTDAETVDVLYHPPEYNGPILFSFREKVFFDKKAATIRIDNGEWSNKIPLDVAGSIGEVTCKANDMPYQIGVHNHLTHNSLTKQITFIPYYIANNKCDFTIALQEASRPGDPWIKVESGTCLPLWPKNDSDHMIVAKVNGQITVPFNYSEAQCTLLKLANNQYGGINVDVQTTEGGVFINFTNYNPGDAPGLLINHTAMALTISEKGIKKDHILPPQRQLLYTWDDPVGEKCIIFGKNKVESDLRRDGVGELILPDGTRGYWVSFLDGLQRVLLFTEDETIATRSESSSELQTITQSIEVRIHGIGLSVVNNETGVDILYIGITSSGVIWECKKTERKRFKQMNINDTEEIEELYQKYLLAKAVKEHKKYRLDSKVEANFDQMVLRKNNKDREIRRTFYPGVWFTMNTSPFQTQIHAKINKIQIDNQLTDYIFPVVLAPIAPPKSVATTTILKPFVECSIVQRVVPNSTVKQFKYATMLIQEFHFKVDLLFLTAIAEMFASKVSDEQAAKLFNEDVASIEKPLSELVETHSMQEQKHFYDNLHLGPLKIHVSFSMAGSDTTALPGILSTLVQGVGVTLTDVNDVVFRLAFFDREFQFFTQQQLTSEITAHYTGQALKQLYVLVLGLDVLGNPYGLVVGLKKGVEDLFYEPFQGAIQGPGEFAEGLALGVKSLFGHTVGGAAGAVSKITGAMGKGLAALTFDDDYQKKRRLYLNKKPANFSEGIARSGKSLVMGFVDGVTGVVSKPMAGAREEGVEGFFKGLGKGAIGFVAHPTAGVVDFASGSFDAVKRATEGQNDVMRLRPTRFIHQDNVLRPYCRAEADGNKMFKEIEKGKYATTDIFVHCEELEPKQEYLLVSNQRVLCASKNDLFGSYTVQWKFRWNQISAIKPIDRGIEIKLKKEGRKMMGIFPSNEVSRKYITVRDIIPRNQLIEIMESQRKGV